MTEWDQFSQMSTWWPSFWGPPPPEPVVRHEPAVIKAPYKHKRLRSPTAVRLIRVMRENINGHIACRIFQADREESPATEYQALSYLWGDQRPTRRIYLQDDNEAWRPFALHESLWSFLDHAWQNKMFEKSFWTDCICLNQKDHKEVAQQVFLMGNIYSGASEVVVWLQFSEYELEEILKALEWGERLERGKQQLLEDAHGDLSFNGSSSSSILKVSLLDLKKLQEQENRRRSRARDTREHTFRRAARCLAINPYWSRVWIVQEIVMAKRVTVVSDKFSLPLDRLLANFEQFRYEGGVCAAPWNIWDMRKSSGSYPLWKLLREFCDHQTSRPADLLYGFLGMVADPDDGLSSVKNISVDYKRPVAHILLDAMFESSPPLNQHGYGTRCPLISRVDNYTFLEKYIGSKRTSQRHSNFARLSRQVWDAVDTMIVVLGGVDETEQEKAALELFRDDKWEPTLHQNGAIMGLVFASYHYSSEPRQRPQNSHSGLEFSSPWRCAAHMRRLSHEEMRTRTAARVADLWSRWHPWDTQLAAAVCGEKSDSCDFSTMVVDIPHIGFRLLLETDMNGCLEARWRLQLDKMGSEGPVSPATRKRKR